MVSRWRALNERWTAVATFADEDEDARRYRFRREMLAEIISKLPNLVSVEADLVDRPFESLPPHLERREVSNALRSIGPQITSSITLESEFEDEDVGEVHITEGYLAEFLQSFPNVARVHLSLPLAPSGRTELHKTLSSLSSLTNLVIGDAAFVNEAFAALSWSSPISLLALRDCDELSLPSLISFLTTLGPSLKTLDLDDVPANLTESESKKLLRPLPLPHLSTLVLATIHNEAILRLFARTTLKELCIAACPAIEYPAWEAFITEQAGSLRTVTLESDHELTDAQVESVEVFCFAKGIECRVERDDDSDDEEEYMDDEAVDPWSDDGDVDDGDGLSDDDDEWIQ